MGGTATRAAMRPVPVELLAPYGVEAVMRDNRGNWIVLVEPKDNWAAEMAAED